MKEYSIQWGAKAVEDLQTIISYIGKNNPVTAKSFGDEIKNKTLLLANFPNMGRKRNSNFPDWLKEFVVHKNYIVFYRVLENENIVEILRIKHVARRSI